ncbi:MAG: YhgE/Pip domain-containing protein [Lactobacillaceae bacterium]|jgi:putative membrane protein|nr:YhgE/Pip domain-containing protein [Lactobacillaceae bacterium]
MLKAEWKWLLNNKFYMLVLLAITIIPSLYAVTFLSSMWDPYGEVKDLPVAIVNKDVPANFNGQTISAGKDVVSGLKKTKALDFHFVNSSEASKGLKDGKYYMVLTLPKNFSQNATTVLSNNPQKMELKYDTSSGHSFIAGKLSASAAEKIKETVSAEVINAYAKNTFSQLTEIGSGMSTAASANNKLANGVNQINDGSTKLFNGLNTLDSGTHTLNSGLSTFDTGLNQYFTGVNSAYVGSTQLVSGAETLATGISKYTTGVNSAYNGSAQLQKGIDQLNDGLTKMDAVNKIENVRGQLKSIKTNLDQIKSQLPSQSDYETQITDLETQIKSVQTLITTFQTNQKTLLSAVDTQVSNTADQLGLTDAQKTALKNSIAQATNDPEIQKQATTLATQLSTLNQTLIPVLDKLKTVQISQALDYGYLDGQLLQLEQIPLGVQKLAAGSKTLTDGLYQLNQNSPALVTGSQKLSQGASSLNSGLSTLDTSSSKLTGGVNSLKTGAGQLANGTEQLSDGAKAIGPALTQVYEGNKTLAQKMQDASNQISLVPVGNKLYGQFSDPVILKATEKDKVANNGTGMAPYMMSAALFVGMMVYNLLIETFKPRKKIDSTMEWIFSKLFIMVVTSVVSSTVLYGLSIEVLGLKPANGLETYLFLIIVGLSFSSLITMFNMYFGEVGAFISLVLLVLQLSGSAGTYPIQLSSPIFKALHDFLPMTYSVHGLRETLMIGGSINNDVLILNGIFAFSMILIIVYFISQRSKMDSLDIKFLEA